MTLLFPFQAKKMMGFQKDPDFPVADVQVHDKTCQG